MALDNGSDTHFVTNGSLLNYQRLEQLTRRRVSVALSIDGATKETYESVRLGGNFDRILDKLAMIKKLRDVHLSRHFAHFGFHLVALRRNIAEVPELIRLARRFDIDSVSVNDFSFTATEFDWETPQADPERVNRFLDEARRVAEELDVNLFLPPPYVAASTAPPGARLWRKVCQAKTLLPAPNRFPQRCFAPWSEPYVCVDGSVRPCCTSDRALDSLSKKTFDEVWNGRPYRRFRRRIDGPLPPMECRSCNIPWGINAGNPGNVMAREGLLVKTFYFFEWRLTRLGGSLLRGMKTIGRRLRSVSDPRPNYYEGRPLRRAAGRKRC
jgi:MoaA/NifB/PqqE/SkfB family radical SAM enzyme